MININELTEEQQAILFDTVRDIIQNSHLRIWFEIDRELKYASTYAIDNVIGNNGLILKNNRPTRTNDLPLSQLINNSQSFNIKIVSGLVTNPGTYNEENLLLEFNNCTIEHSWPYEILLNQEMVTVTYYRISCEDVNVSQLLLNLTEIEMEGI